MIRPLADRFGSRRTLLLGLLTVLVPSLATDLAPSFLILIMVAPVEAIGRAAVLPVAQAILGRTSPTRTRGGRPSARSRRASPASAF